MRAARGADRRRPCSASAPSPSSRSRPARSSAPCSAAATSRSGAGRAVRARDGAARRRARARRACLRRAPARARGGGPRARRGAARCARLLRRRRRRRRRHRDAGRHHRAHAGAAALMHSRGARRGAPPGGRGRRDRRSAASSLRLLATRGIWLDEATSIHQAQMPLGDMLTDLRTTDVHPPLHHILLWGTVRLLGDGELAVRMPSLIAATAMIPMLYRRRARHLRPARRLAAATLAAVAPFAVWYADEARMYALFMLFALLAVWMQIRMCAAAAAALVARVRGLAPRRWCTRSTSGSCSSATQMLGVRRRGRPRRAAAAARGWRLDGRCSRCCWRRCARFAHEQFAANEAAGKGFQQPRSRRRHDRPGRPGPALYAALTNFAWAVLGYHSDGTMTAHRRAVAARRAARAGAARPRPLVDDAARRRLRPRCRRSALFVLGQLKPFVFEVRYFIGIVPLALLLIARAADELAAPAGRDRPGDPAVAAVAARPRPRRPAAQPAPTRACTTSSGALRAIEGARQAGRRGRVHAAVSRPRGRLLRARGPGAEADGPGPARAAPRPQGLRPGQLPGQAAVPRRGQRCREAPLAPAPPGAPRAGPQIRDLGVLR